MILWSQRPKVSYFAVKLQGSNSVGRGPLPDYPNPLSPGLRPVLRTDSARDSLLWKAGSNEVSLHFLTTREVSWHSTVSGRCEFLRYEEYWNQFAWPSSEASDQSSRHRD